MKQKFFLIMMLTVFGLGTVLGQQVRVSNGFGQSLTVTVGDETKVVDQNGVGVFTASADKVRLDCRAANGKMFSVDKNINRGSVVIMPEDGTGKYQGNTTLDQPTKQVTLTISKAQITTKNAEVIEPRNLNYQEIALVHEGKKQFQILSKYGLGYKFDSAHTRTKIYPPLGNLDIAVALNPEDSSRAIRRYALFRTWIYPEDSMKVMNDKNIEIMSTDERIPVRFENSAENYEVYINIGGDKGKISLGNGEISSEVQVNVGQVFLEISYTGPDGFQPASLVMTHITKFNSTALSTKKNKNVYKTVKITKEMLVNALKINW